MAIDGGMDTAGNPVTVVVGIVDSATVQPEWDVTRVTVRRLIWATCALSHSGRPPL